MSKTKTGVCAGVLLFCVVTLSSSTMISRAEVAGSESGYPTMAGSSPPLNVMKFDQQYPEKPPDDPFKARLIPRNSKIYIAPILPENPTTFRLTASSTTWRRRSERRTFR